MKQTRRFLSYITALLIPLVMSGSVYAAPEPSVQELHVTAMVLDRRDIIIDRRGDIIEITSNTRNDIMPNVYEISSAEQNKRELTPELYAQYRSHVPEGTASYGVLYKRTILATILLPKINS